jgi:Zn-finger nucleic acid-binding protein
MVFSPVNASRNVVEKYKRYLSTIFEINNPVYAKQFNSELNQAHAFVQGPYLDVTDAFVKGNSITELIESGVLPKRFGRLNMPQNRSLYLHQQEAIEKVYSGKNIVVSTGTGSGKTESFLIPILNDLIRQDEAGQLNAGVRALIIYPMNALANDQVERLRGLLSEYPEITYGSYTGQTKQKYDDAIVEYKKLNNDETPQKNELISREQMKETPPNIFITNYAMLEYLMVRPDDNVFFDGDFSEQWKYIVLDEAHVYSGSTGIEVSMLLRRLQAKLQKEKLHYILTSATLGGEKDNLEVALFAENLCNQRFSDNDVIRAKRIKLEPKHELKLLPIGFYNEIAGLIEEEAEDQSILASIKKYNNSFPSSSVEECLYDMVLHDNNYWVIRGCLLNTRTVSSLAEDLKWSLKDVENFVTVASKSEKDGDRLFDARYHMFLRATESVFVTLNPSNKLFLTRKNTHVENGEIYKVFEIATCSSCHEVYLAGQNKNNILEQHNTVNDEDKSIFYLGRNVADSDEDHMLEVENILHEEYELCAYCGYLSRPGALKDNCCEHDKSAYVTVQKINIENPSKVLTKCVACENTNSSGILRMFFTGQEAVTSVIGTALFEELPSYSIKREIAVDEDDTGFGLSGTNELVSKTEVAKQFIAFSDSRQAAAFFSSYFDQTYRNILYKRLVVEVLKDPVYRKRGKIVNDFVEDLIYHFEKNNVAARNKDVTRKEAWKAILQEAVDNNGNTSLSSLGFLGLHLSDEGIPSNTKLNLSKEDVAAICNVFAMGMMADAAVYYDANLNSADKEYYTYNGIEYSYTLSDANPRAYQRSFIPTSANKTNKRLDYFTRVLNKAGNELTDEKTRELLEKGIWRIFESQGFIKAVNSKYKIDLSKLKISNGGQWHKCSKCAKVTVHNVYQVCPSYKCDGVLKPVHLEEMYANNHYYRMYQELDIRELRIVEHTAQLNKETAYEFQKKFKRKEIDVLSCSTTFEMGVDVGSLETVFMRNMPPSPSNYAQRAGRAGRSKQAAAYAITFCNKSSHDFSFFRHPERMIKGNIQPPKFNVENDKIAIRHLYASALSYFWKEHPEYFSKASHMTEGTDQTTPGLEVFRKYLMDKPEGLKNYLLRFLPGNLARKFGVETFEWLPLLLSPDENMPGTLTKAVKEYEYEVSVLREAIERSIAAEGRTDHLRERMRVYRNEEILSFLSRKNVLPKYGFPVDTVEMGINDRNNKTKLGLQLQRDLSMAISEYAPGSQIVANGNLITSRYIRKVPSMSWRQYDYILCECKTLNIDQHVEEEDYSQLDTCKQCKGVLDVSKRKVFLVPEFGFEADGDKITKPGLKKPKRTYRSDIAYVGYKNQIEAQKYAIGSASFELGMSQADEMAILNDSNFFVCEYCGYTSLDEKMFRSTKREVHYTPSGYRCRNDGNNTLKKFALGYRFETDVVQLKFLNPDLTDYDYATSVLHGVLKGVSSYLNIEQNDISGCLQFFYNDVTGRPNFELVLYDRTPGGAGHVRRLNSEYVLESVLRETLSLMEDCDCGGEDMDTSCYTCLRGYYNQKHHDILKRRNVIEFLKEVLS